MQKYCPQCFGKYPTDVERCPQDGSALVGVTDRDLTGEMLDERYEVLSKLGQGGMGVVYRATQRYVKRAVALKVLRRAVVHDESSLKRFLVEAQAIASLRNQHTITLHDFGVTGDGLLYFTMDLIEGVALSKLIREAGAIPWRRAAGLLLQACDSLAEAHNQGILHRDLKPDNLMVSLVDGKDFVTVLDFGIAKILDDDSVDKLTATGMICGTPAYLSPEQASGQEVGPSSDIYALGIILYEMLTGQPPFVDKTAISILMKHLNEEALPVHEVRPELDIPPELDIFIRKALAKLPANRHTSVAEFRAALLEAADHAESGAALTMPADLPHAHPTRTAVEPVLDDPARPASPFPGPSRRSNDAGGTAATIESLSPEAQATAAGFSVGKAWAIGGGIAVLVMLVFLVWQPWQDDPNVNGYKGPEAVPGRGTSLGSMPDAGQKLSGTAQPSKAGGSADSAQSSDVGGSPLPLPATAEVRVQDVIEMERSGALTSGADTGPDLDSGQNRPGATEAPAAAATVPPLQVIIDTDPHGGRIRWKDEAGEGRTGPLLLSLTPDDDGREIVCTRPGHRARTVRLNRADLQKDPRLVVRLDRKKSSGPRPEARGVPEDKGKSTGTGNHSADGKTVRQKEEKKDQDKKEDKGWGTVEIPK